MPNFIKEGISDDNKQLDAFTTEIYSITRLAPAKHIHTPTDLSGKAKSSGGRAPYSVYPCAFQKRKVKQKLVYLEACHWVTEADEVSASACLGQAELRQAWVLEVVDPSGRA